MDVAQPSEIGGKLARLLQRRSLLRQEKTHGRLPLLFVQDVVLDLFDRFRFRRRRRPDGSGGDGCLDVRRFGVNVGGDNHNRSRETRLLGAFCSLRKKSVLVDDEKLWRTTRVYS